MTAHFDEAAAARALGFPGQPFQSIKRYAVDDVFWIRIGSGDKTLGRPVIVRQGHVVTDVGYGVGAAWLRELAARNTTELDTTVIPQVMRWYDALPIGWSENYQFDPQTNERGRVALHPIEVKLVGEELREVAEQ